MTTVDLVVAGGIVVQPGGAAPGDVVVVGECIVDVAAPGRAPSATRVIDAGGKIVLPGGVDVHTHFLIGFMRQRSVYDFYTGSIAALRGGTTTFIDFALQRRGRSMLDGVKHRRVQADRHVVCDYGLHLIATDINDSSLAELPELVEAGVTTLKVYMIYEKEQLRVDDGPLLELMKGAARCGMMVGLHAENASIIDYATERCLAANQTAPRFHASSHPAIAEREAISRALILAEAAGAAVYIFHMSIGAGVELIAAARARGVRAFAETCTHYLALLDDKYDREDASLYVMSPPLRRAVDRDRLWEGLRDGLVAGVTSDDASYSAEAKREHEASFDAIPNGIPGVEVRLSVLYTLGVAAARLNLVQLAEICSGAPARLFGLSPQKGSIRGGADADMVILDPERRVRLSAASNYGPIGYSPYEGLEVTGIPLVTIRRGEVLVESGQFLGREGSGRFLHRQLPDTVPGPSGFAP